MVILKSTKVPSSSIELVYREKMFEEVRDLKFNKLTEI